MPSRVREAAYIPTGLPERQQQSRQPGVWQRQPPGPAWRPALAPQLVRCSRGQLKGNPRPCMLDFELKQSMKRGPPPCPVIPSVPDRDILCALPARCRRGCSGSRRALHPALRLPPLGPLLAIPRLLPPGFLPPPEHQYSAMRLKCHTKAAPVGSSSEACPRRLSISCLLLSSAAPRRHASMSPDRLLCFLTGFG